MNTDAATPQVVSWLPLHTAGAAISDLRDADSEVVHLSHTNPVSWTSIATTISKALDRPLVPYAEWLRRLEESADNVSIQNAKDDPALRLIDFFRSLQPLNDRTTPYSEVFGFSSLSIETVTAVSKILEKESAIPLGAADVQMWLSYWKSINYI